MARAIKGDTQHVFPLGNGWAVKAEHAKKFFLITITQAEAVSAARLLAKHTGSDLVVYTRNGTVRSKTSYSTVQPKSAARKK